MNKTKFLLGLFLFGLIGVLLASFLLTAGKKVGQYFFGRSYAEGELRSYVEAVSKQQVNGVTCQPIDTDDNGYVACDYTTVAEPNRTQTLECAAWGWSGFFNRGCKQRLPGLY
ncbi:MAG: hypothetical protein ACKO24_04325 [Leptolyngbyaceae cyanobacterium]